jgi:hypothetical protein
VRVCGRVKDVINEHAAERNTLTRRQRNSRARVRAQLAAVGQRHRHELDFCHCFFSSVGYAQSSAHTRVRCDPLGAVERASDWGDGRK